MYIEIFDTGFRSRYKDKIIFERSGIIADEITMGFIALAMAFKYNKQKIPFINIKSLQTIFIFKHRVPTGSKHNQKILDQCIKVRDELNINAFGLIRHG